MKATCSLSLVSLALLAACGGSSSGTTPGADAGVNASTSVTLGSSGHPELVSLTTRVTSIGYVDELGFQTVPFNTEPITVEWVGLAEEQMWLGIHAIPKSSYSGLYVTFDAQGTRGVMEDGTAITFATAEQAFLPFDMQPPASAETWLAYVELDLASSVQLGVTPSFQAVGGASDELPALPTETLYGVVRDVAASGVVTVAAYADVELRRPLGGLEVELADLALLLDETGRSFPSREAFYGSLRPGLSLLEFEGNLNGMARLLASRIQIIDPALGQGTTLPVRIEGKVTALRASGFEMTVRRVLTGAESARPVLEGLDSPDRIEVLVDDMTRVLAGDDATTPIRPGVGHAVTAEFREFVNEPFPADLVIVRRSVQCFRGGIGETGTATGFVLVSRSDDPAGDPNRLHVSVGEAPITLLLRGRPLLRLSDLVTGMVAEACGALDETGDRRVLEARNVQVHPGHFVRANVTTFDAANRSFDTANAFVFQSFGADVESGSIAVQLDERAVIRGEVDSVERFFELLRQLPANERVIVEGRGLGANAPQTVRIFELDVFRVGSGG